MPWDTMQRDELSREFTVPHHSTWNGEVAVTGDIVTVDADVNLIPVGSEITLHSPKYGVGVYRHSGGTPPVPVGVLVLLQVTGYTIVVPRTINFIVALAAVDLTGASPVPGGANTPLVWWTYSGFTNAAGGDVTITAGSEPVIRYSINLKA